MPLRPAELRRGRVVWAIYPFAAQLPAEFLDGDERRRLQTVEQYARLRKGDPTDLITTVRLRPVLLLHDGVKGDHDDLLCLRINTVKPRHKRSGSWARIQAHEHPFFFHLPAHGPSELPQESIIDLTSVGALHKSAIVNLKPPGTLDSGEMRIVSERLVKVLELDLGNLIAARARELLKLLRQKIEPGH